MGGGEGSSKRRRKEHGRCESTTMGPKGKLGGGGFCKRTRRIINDESAVGCCFCCFRDGFHQPSGVNCCCCCTGIGFQRGFGIGKIEEMIGFFKK